jgi:multidrug efflux pump
LKIINEVNFFSFMKDYFKNLFLNLLQRFIKDKISYEILVISFPFMVSIFFEATSFTLMLFIISYLKNDVKLIASLGSSIYVIWVLYGISTSFSNGLVSVISRLLGDKNYEEINYTFSISFIFGTFWALFIFLIYNFLISDLIFKFLNLGENEIKIAKDISYYFLFVMFFSIWAAVIFGTLQGLAKTKVIMYMSIFAVIGEVIATFVFVKYFDLYIPLAINLAWFIGELIRMGIGMFFLTKDNVNFDFGYIFRKRIADSMLRFLELVYIGIPVKVGALVFGVVYFFLISILSGIGKLEGYESQAVAGLTISQRFEVIIWMIDGGLSVACANLIGRTLGYEYKKDFNLIKKIKQANLIAYKTFIIGFILFVPAFILFTFFPSNLLNIFIKDPITIKIGSGYLFYTGIFGIAMLVNAVISGYFIALGFTLPLTIAMVIFSIMRIPISELLVPYLKYDAVYLAINITNIFMAIFLYLFLYFYIIKLTQNKNKQ